MAGLVIAELYTLFILCSVVPTENHSGLRKFHAYAFDLISHSHLHIIWSGLLVPAPVGSSSSRWWWPTVNVDWNQQDLTKRRIHNHYFRVFVNSPMWYSALSSITLSTKTHNWSLIHVRYVVTFNWSREPNESTDRHGSQHMNNRTGWIGRVSRY